MKTTKPNSRKAAQLPPWEVLDSKKHELHMRTLGKIVDKIVSERPLLRVTGDKLQRVFQDKAPEDVRVDWTMLQRVGKIEKRISLSNSKKFLNAVMNFHQVVATDFPTEDNRWKTQRVSRSQERIRMHQYLMFGDSLLAIYNELKASIEGLASADLAVRLHMRLDPEMLLHLMEQFHFALDWLGMYAERQREPGPKRSPGRIRRMGLENFIAEVISIYHRAGGPKESYTYYHLSKDGTKQFRGPLIDFILALINIIKDMLPAHALPADQHLQNEIGEKIKELSEKKPKGKIA